VREEILADFTGDALADPQFLQTLATNNPTKFRLFLNEVLNWLKAVAIKLAPLPFAVRTGSNRSLERVLYHFPRCDVLSLGEFPHTLNHVEADKHFQSPTLFCHQLGAMLLDTILRGHIFPS